MKISVKWAMFFSALMLALALVLPTPARGEQKVETRDSYWWCHFDDVAVNCSSTSNSCYCVVIIVY